MAAVSKPVGRLAGEVRAPGDKSCSHRALMLAAAADGETRIDGLLEGADVVNTAWAAAALGARVGREAPGRWRVRGVGAAGFRAPAAALDFGNSGTGARLMMGLVAGHAVAARFVGDASLSARPMERVLKPLREMGAAATTAAGGRLPVELRGGALTAIRYAPPEPSAQVKSAVLLAGLRADGVTIVEESQPTRDHTERMLRGFGVAVGETPREGRGAVIAIEGSQTPAAADCAIPGDPSSAAFLAAAALVAAQADIRIANVMDNPTRDGFFRMLAAMGAAAACETEREGPGERSLAWRLAAGPLRAASPPESLIASMIDELPIFAVLAAFAEGETTVRGAAELRVKESDRIAALCAMLRVNGVEVEELPDGFVVQGRGPGGVPGGGLVETRHDHRIAMSALVMGLGARRPVAVDDVAMIATSYPGFLADLAQLGAEIDGPAR